MRMTPEEYAARQLKSAEAKARSMAPVPETAKTRLQALGRLKVGVMNGTEERYAALLEARKLAGEVAWYKFEGIKLRLADNTFLTPDFAVMLSTGELECHEVKGGVWQDDSRAKTKIAADIYPFKFIGAMPIKKKDGGGWKIEEF